ncbi:MAG TPA: L,D-transpeptidase, partial [Pilimelia sp.]|nr:L,D-transpeptidase [Pilimelia sp.]
SVGDQGRRNVSHGCVNVSPSNAVWLFGLTMVGDPVTVRGTERRLVNGNGWTPWMHTWADYIKGSALPVPPDLVRAGTRPTAGPTPTAQPTATPTPTT